jgi:hypothetical protein
MSRYGLVCVPIGDTHRGWVCPMGIACGGFPTKMGSAIPDAPRLRLGAITFINPILDPLIHFLFKPSDAVRAQRYPFGETTCLFETGDMLRRIADLRAHFRFRE